MESYVGMFVGLLNSPSTSYVVWNPGVQTNAIIWFDIDTYPPTVPEHPGQSRTYCSRPLSRTQDAIYLECPGKSGHPLLTYC